MNHESTDMTTNPNLLFRLRDIRDRQAWALFVEVYGPLIFSYCRRKRLQESDAADVSQEVLTIVAPTKLSRLQIPPARTVDRSASHYHQAEERPDAKGRDASLYAFLDCEDVSMQKQPFGTIPEIIAELAGNSQKIANRENCKPWVAPFGHRVLF